jgi:hypothetical protein
MSESTVMVELRKVRDRISGEIREMDTNQMKEYFNSESKPLLNEIKRIREQKLKAM